MGGPEPSLPHRESTDSLIYIYIYRRIAQHGTASVGLAQARPNYATLHRAWNELLLNAIYRCLCSHALDYPSIHKNIFSI